jgi:peptide/nickel transport system permease protein
MLRFIVNRLGSMAVTMLVISMLVFFIAEVVPVDPARNALGRYATEEKVQELREKMGLDRPAIVRYTDWITGIIRGDFGMSIHYQRPVGQLVGVRLMRSLALAALGFAFMMPTGLLFGSIAGINEGKPIDRVLSLMSGIFVSVPTYASGIFMIVIFALWLDWLPGASIPDPDATIGESLIKLALPIMTLALDEIGYLTRMMRVSTAEVMDSDYVRTAVLKGVPKTKVIRRHAFRNAMIAPFTAIMLHVNWLIGGIVVVEVLFNYPGLGSLLYQAALRNDIIAVASQAVADIGVYYLNPRLRFD